MHLVEIFLPLKDNGSRRFPQEMFAEVHKTLTERFGGVTWFSRAPAHGVTESGGKHIHDDIIVVEVMADAIDKDWWSSFRTSLEVRFVQEEILIRASHVQRL